MQITDNFGRRARTSFTANFCFFKIIYFIFLRTFADKICFCLVDKSATKLDFFIYKFAILFSGPFSPR